MPASALLLLAALPIVNGNAATAGQFPTVVAVQNTGLCAGTLVAPDVVLTAARCLHPGTLGLADQDEVTARTRVVLDTIDVSDGSTGGGRVIAARATVAIGWFGLSHDPDVGLVFLGEAVTDRAPTPINLAPADALTGVAVTMIGFGRGAGGNPGHLLYTAPKASVSCAAFTLNNALFLCFDQRLGPGLCDGDAGGPALAEIDGVTRVVGIASFADDDCAEVGVYMRTDALVTRDFLAAQVPELVPVPQPAPPVALEPEDGCNAGGGGLGGGLALGVLALLRRRSFRSRSRSYDYDYDDADQSTRNLTRARVRWARVGSSMYSSWVWKPLPRGPSASMAGTPTALTVLASEPPPWSGASPPARPSARAQVS